MLSFELNTDAHQFMSKLKLIKRAISLGGVESTITSPARTSHSKMSASERASIGVTENLVRLSVGLEDSNDLIDKKASTIKARGMVEEQKWVGGRIGYTLIRSLSMSEKVHMAMMSRGFSGEVHIMQEFKMKNRDYLAGAFAISMSLVLVLISQDVIRV